MPPSPASSSSVPSSPVPTIIVQNNTQPGVIVGAVIGSIFGGILLAIGCFLFYKRYKNRITTPGNSYPREELLQTGERATDLYNHGQEAVSDIQEPIHNHGQEYR